MSLIAVTLLTVVLGLFVASGSALYSLWQHSNNSYNTDVKLKEVQSALRDFYVRNGRYPCPAAIDAPLDGTSVDGIPFGTEVTSDCTMGSFAGTFRTTGDDGEGVRIGAVPVRTLNIADDLIYDGYKQRFVYAITEKYAKALTTADPYPVTGNEGDISIVDAANNDSTSQSGNIVQLVFSMGQDINGAYDANGGLISPCDDTLLSGENCDFLNDATFRNSVNKSNNVTDPLAPKVIYPPSKTVISCGTSGSSGTKDAAFLVDTSGSMGSAGFCPMGGSCDRIHDAQWALRRVMLSRLHSTSQQSDPGSTSLTGFVYQSAHSYSEGTTPPAAATTDAPSDVANIGNNFDSTGILFDDPSAPGYTPLDEADALTALETQMSGMCPGGWTPLGIHLMALADRLGDGEDDRVNKIIVLSDGLNTNGIDPMAAAFYIQTQYPNLEVDIVDVVGNDDLRDVAEATGGSYYRTDDPDTLLNALREAAGICDDYEPTIPSDTNHC
jgi:hypothetical protein